MLKRCQNCSEEVDDAELDEGLCVDCADEAEMAEEELPGDSE